MDKKKKNGERKTWAPNRNRSKRKKKKKKKEKL